MSKQLKQYSNEEIAQIVEKIVRELGRNYCFDIYEVDDLINEAYIITLEIMEKYDGIRPLENFLRVSLANRLKNFRRDNSYLPEPKDVNSKEWKKWKKRFGTKKDILEAIPIHHVNEENESRFVFCKDLAEYLDVEEIKELIEKYLPVQYRMDYIKIKHGIKISKNKENKIVEIIRDIVYEKYGKEI